LPEQEPTCDVRRRPPITVPSLRRVGQLYFAVREHSSQAPSARNAGRSAPDWPSWRRISTPAAIVWKTRVGSQLAIAVPNCYVSASIFGRTTGPLRLALPGARFRLSPNSTNRERATKPCARSHVHTVS